MKIFQQWIAIAMVTLCGCHNTDVSVYGEDENIFIRAARDARNQKVILGLEIGSSDYPYNHVPEIEIKLSNGEILNLLKLDLAVADKSFDEMTVATRTNFSSGTPRKPWDNGKPFQHITLRNYPNDFSAVLVLQDNNVVYAYFGTDSYTESIPPFQIKVGTSDWHSFPLKKDVLAQLIGEKRVEYPYLDWQ